MRIYVRCNFVIQLFVTTIRSNQTFRYRRSPCASTWSIRWTYWGKTFAWATELVSIYHLRSFQKTWFGKWKYPEVWEEQTVVFVYFLVEFHELIAEQVESTRAGEKMYCFRGKMLRRTSNACNFWFCLGANITHEWTFHHGLPGGSEKNIFHKRPYSMLMF